MPDTLTALAAAVAELQAGRGVALCAIVRTRGSTPQPAGTLVAVDEAGRMDGSLGGGCVEALIRRTAHEMLLRKEGGLLNYDLDHDFGFDDGMICGGTLDVGVQILLGQSSAAALVQTVQELERGSPSRLCLRVPSGGRLEEYRIRVEARPTLVVAGGGHITRCLAPLACQLGFAVHVIDERKEYANPDRFPSPMRAVAGEIGPTLRNWPIDGNTYVVIVTRGHKHDETALQAVLGSPARYLGMIGSRRKVQVVFDDLRHRGVAEPQLARVRAPIGLDIGAKTAEEIAVSIAAELVGVRRKEAAPAVEGPFHASRP